MKYAVLVALSAVVCQELVASKKDCPPLVMARAPECDGLDAGKCAALAEDARRGDRVGTGIEKAKRLYEAACQKGDALSCVWAAEFQLGNSYCRAQGLFGRACDMGDYVSCVQAADMISNGSPDGQAAPDPTRAAALYEKACTGGDGGGCAAFADVLELGAGVPKDQRKAAEMRERAKQFGYQSE
jgi:TPR repeat protein